MNNAEKQELYEVVRKVKGLLIEIENILEDKKPTPKGKVVEWQKDGSVIVHCLESFCKDNYYYECTKGSKCEGRVFDGV